MKISIFAFSILLLTSFFAGSIALMGDELTSEMYGFPIPWHSSGAVISLEESVYVGPFALNLLLFYLSSILVFRYLKTKMKEPSKRQKITFWLFCSFSISLGLLPFVADRVHFTWWYYPEFRLIEYLGIVVA